MYKKTVRFLYVLKPFNQIQPDFFREDIPYNLFNFMPPENTNRYEFNE